jgi:hypothetical protein
VIRHNAVESRSEFRRKIRTLHDVIDLDGRGRISPGVVAVHLDQFRARKKIEVFHFVAEFPTKGWIIKRTDL